MSLLDVRDLRTSFVTEAGVIPAVDGVSLRIRRGQTVALVGESGCGKTVTALSIMRLIPQPPGRIIDGRILLNEPPSQEHAHANVAIQYAAVQANDGMSESSNVQHGRAALGHGTRPGNHPIDLLQLTEKQMRKIRGNRIAMIFQDPLVSLNPVYTVGEQIVEAIELHQPLRGKAARECAVEMLHKVGIPAPKRRASDYPHRMSGGMLQRVMIAMALSCRPCLLIADEPTTALDVTVQMQILELLRSAQQETQMGLLIITHDFGVVAGIADYVYVMYAGRIVEHAPAGDLLTDPLHPYTQGLLRCIPRRSQRGRRLEVIPGQMPDPLDLPTGCRFHPRCRLSAERARRTGRIAKPVASQAGDAVLRRCAESYEQEPSGQPKLCELKPGHYVACWEAGVF